MITILDASIAVKWFFHDEPNAVLARHILENLSSNPEKYIVPELFHIEVQAVLTRKSSYDYEFSSKALELINKLGIRTAPTHGAVLHSAVKFACANKLSVYDGIYYALAVELSGKWLTADAKAVKRMDSKRVMLLEDFAKRK